MATRITLALMSTLLVSACGAHHQSASEPQLGATSGMHLAQAAEASGDYQLAESVYAGAADSAPGDAEVQLRYADALVRGGKIDQARALLTQRMHSVSDQRALHGALGQIYILQGQPQQAIAEFDAMGSTEPRWLVNKAVATDLLGHYAEAQAMYRQALAQEPNEPTTINDLALSLLLSGHKTEAAEILAPLAGRDDLSPRIKTNYAVLMAATGHIESARAALPGVDDGQIMRLANAIDKR